MKMSSSVLTISIFCSHSIKKSKEFTTNEPFPNFFPRPHKFWIPLVSVFVSWNKKGNLLVTHWVGKCFLVNVFACEKAGIGIVSFLHSHHHHHHHQKDLFFNLMQYFAIAETNLNTKLISVLWKWFQYLRLMSVLKFQYLLKLIFNISSDL